LVEGGLHRSPPCLVSRGDKAKADSSLALRNDSSFFCVLAYPTPVFSVKSAESHEKNGDSEIDGAKECVRV
jgi:hypothetical protein